VARAPRYSHRVRRPKRPAPKRRTHFEQIPVVIVKRVARVEISVERRPTRQSKELTKPPTVTSGVMPSGGVRDGRKEQ